jgi:hypothetical protein
MVQRDTPRHFVFRTFTVYFNVFSSFGGGKINVGGFFIVLCRVHDGFNNFFFFFGIGGGGVLFEGTSIGFFIAANGFNYLTGVKSKSGPYYYSLQDLNPEKDRKSVV